MKRYEVMIWSDRRHQWEECGEGELTKIQADRIAREIKTECGIRTKVQEVEK